MRELTEYEKTKWFDEYNRFKRPEYIQEGTEWSYFMDHLTALVKAGSSYGMSDEFELLAITEYLDQYYGHVEYIYEGSWGDDPDDVGLPPAEQYEAYRTRAASLLGRLGYPTAHRMAIDWAMRWRERHMEEFLEEQRVKELQRQLELAKKSRQRRKVK